MERIAAKTIDRQGCEVYLLNALYNDYYPVLGYADIVIGYEHLNFNEVWKVGMTCNGQNGRYPYDKFYRSKDGNIILNGDKLVYNPIYHGTKNQSLIFERILIYTYPLWSGHTSLTKPPGCKIFR